MKDSQEAKLKTTTADNERTEQKSQLLYTVGEIVLTV